MSEYPVPQTAKPTKPPHSSTTLVGSQIKMTIMSTSSGNCRWRREDKDNEISHKCSSAPQVWGEKNAHERIRDDKFSSQLSIDSRLQNGDKRIPTSQLKGGSTSIVIRRHTKRRRVHFGRFSEVYELDADNEQVTAEIGWYSRKELFQMKVRAKRLPKAGSSIDVLSDAYGANVEENDIVQRLGASEDFQDRRGLELLSSEHHCFSRNLTICSVKCEVLLEQASQVIQGKSDAVKIAKAYAYASEPAVRFARLLGIVDALTTGKQMGTLESDSSLYSSKLSHLSNHSAFSRKGDRTTDCEKCCGDSNGSF